MFLTKTTITLGFKAIFRALKKNFLELALDPEVGSFTQERIE